MYRRIKRCGSDGWGGEVRPASGKLWSAYFAFLPIGEFGISPTKLVNQGVLK